MMERRDDVGAGSVAELVSLHVDRVEVGGVDLNESSNSLSTVGLGIDPRT